MSPVDAARPAEMLNRRPIATEHAEELARRLFDVAGRAERLDGEYDDNFRLVAGDRTYVLKIAPPGEDPSLIEAQDAALRHLGRRASRLTSAEIGGTTRYVRLLDFIPGQLLAHVSPHSAALLRSLGK